MADIVCVPLCSNCHQIIEEADYRYFSEEVYSAPGLYLKYPRISPIACEKCGAVFDNIIVPSGFPIKTRDFLKEEE